MSQPQSNSGAHSRKPLPLGKAERDGLIRRYYELTDRLLQGIAATPRLSRQEQNRFHDEREAVKHEYFDRLPRLTLSRCPFCGSSLERAFDPWGLDGFWWQDDETVSYQETPGCSDFAVLLGAVNLNGLPPKGGRSDALPGPEIPFVVPRILQLPTMKAVVSSVPLANGYTAYPITYFAEARPPAGALTQPWTRKQYSFQDATGRGCWTVRTDPWDFDLLPWVEKGKLKWIKPGDAEFTISQEPWTTFPYANLPGRRTQLIIQEDTLTTIPPPANEEIHPFSE